MEEEKMDWQDRVAVVLVVLIVGIILGTLFYRPLCWLGPLAIKPFCWLMQEPAWVIILVVLGILGLESWIREAIIKSEK